MLYVQLDIRVPFVFENFSGERLEEVQNLLSSRLLSKNLKIKIYRTIILPVFCMGVKPGR